MSNWGKKPLTISTFNPVLKIGRTELGGPGLITGIPYFFLVLLLDACLESPIGRQMTMAAAYFHPLSAYGGCIEIEGWSARDVDDTWTISLLMKLAPPLSPLPGKVDTEAGES
ncbi:hypothetical protein OIU76_006115 [Salix suchowensis]|nr:hypothetical protein OIU76_006115 [Salix suchowensis]